jgi:GT2 family glycosyltransferase
VSSRKVAVIVLNWNGWADSLACLDSLEPSVEQGLARTIVVDNASTDESSVRIRRWFHSRSRDVLEIAEKELSEASPRPNAVPPYVFIHAHRNSGYAAGNNLGIRFGLGLADTQYVFVLNNDTIIEADSIARLIAWAERDPAAGVVGSTLVENRGQLRIAGGSNYSVLLTTTKPTIVVDGSSESHMDYVAGAAQFIRATALRRVGLFSEDYFLFFEELDLTRRIIGAGFKIAWCPESIVYHLGGRTTGSRSQAQRKKSILAEYHSNLSCLIFMQKFHPRLLWLAAPVRFLLKVVHDLIHLQPALLIPLVRAYRDYMVQTRRKHA